MEQVTDQLETMILLALDASHKTSGHGATRRNPISGGEERYFDPAEELGMANMPVNSAYTADLTDNGRLFSKDKNDLLTHPGEIIGDEEEVMLMKPGGMVWAGFRRIKKPPRGVSFLGRPAFWYEVHRREVNADGSGNYWKQLLPLSKTGAMIPAIYGGVALCNEHLAGVLYLSASIIEDSKRSHAMLAAVKDAAEIKFPVPIDDYKDVFSDRDGPMNGARKKAIIHWVAQHMRHSTRGNEHEVKRHTRGVQEFTIDGLRIRLSPNAEGQQEAR